MFGIQIVSVFVIMCLGTFTNKPSQTAEGVGQLSDSIT